MEGQYQVFLDEKVAGKIQIKRSGLYYEILCRCHLPADTVFRLSARWEDRQENIGILIPEEDGSFSLKKKIACRHFGKGKPTFTVARNRGPLAQVFIPIRPEEPFAYIHRLNDAFLEYRDGQPGIRLQKNPGTE